MEMNVIESINLHWVDVTSWIIRSTDPVEADEQKRVNDRLFCPEELKLAKNANASRGKQITRAC